jgi:hypothetical protein
VIRILIGISVGVVLAFLVAGTQDDSVSKDFGQIRMAVADLGLRVGRLEHADGVAHGPVDDSAAVTDQTVVRSMVVGGIQTAESQPPDPDQVQQLQRDIDALQKTVDTHQDNVQRVAGNTYYVGGYYSGGHYGYDHSRSGRNDLEQSQQQMANRYAAQLAIKKKQLDDLMQAAKVPHQIIHGHDGDVFFTLRTRQSLSDELRSISIGDTVTWGGTRDNADGQSEEWTLSSIHKVERQ